jgi:hypothetical protein
MALDGHMLLLYDAGTNRQYARARLDRIVEEEPHKVEGRQQ